MPRHAWLMAPVVGLYLLAAVSYFAEIIFRVQRASRPGRMLLMAAAALQGAALLGHAASSSDFPNLFESASIVVWLLVLVFLLSERWAKTTALGVFVTPLALVISVSMLAVRSHTGPHELDKRWLLPHVGAVVLGYTALALAVCFALVYLYDERLLKTKHASIALKYFPSLETSDRLMVGFTAFGLSMLTAGIVTGLLWSYARAVASPWTQQRMVLSIVAWCLFAAYLFVRKVIGWQSSRAKWVIVLGFVVLVITMVGYRLSA